MNEELIKDILELLRIGKLSFSKIVNSVDEDEDKLKIYINFLLNKKYIKQMKSSRDFIITAQGREALRFKKDYATDFSFEVNLGLFKAEIKKRQLTDDN